MRQQIAEVFLQASHPGLWIRRLTLTGLHRQRKLRGLLALLGLDGLSRAGDGVSLVVEQRLDVEHGLDIAASVETLAGAAFMRLELWKLRLPEAQHVRGNIAEAGDLSDAEVELVRDIRGPRRREILPNWLVLRHSRAPEKPNRIFRPV